MSNQKGRAARTTTDGHSASNTTDLTIPSGQDPRWFIRGYDLGESVGYSRGVIMGERSGYKRAEVDCLQRIRSLVEDACVEHQGDVNRAVVDLVLARGSYAALADKRGQPERAARQRQILAERGVTV